MPMCPNCGSNNHESARFCVSCGRNLEGGYTQKAQQYTTSQPTAGASPPECLWCKQPAGFTEEEGKLDSKWGVTAHKVRIFICNNCGFSHLFSLGRSIWDFD